MSNSDNIQKRLTFLVKAAELTQRVATAPILERYHLSYAQLAMLLTVARTPGATGASLARMHGITAQSAGEVIGALVRRGLMQRVPDPARRKSLGALLTEEGERIYADAQTMLDAIETGLIDGVADTDLVATKRVLTAIAHWEAAFREPRWP